MPSQPHLILVSIDALRADHLSMSGYQRATSPNIDSFAAAAWRYPDAATPIPKTGPSFATILSGRPPSEHGVDSNEVAIPDALPLLAEQLSAAGYQTAAFVSNPILTRSKGFARGFATYFLAPDRDGVERVNQAFVEWAKGVDWSHPVFVWIHYIDPHGPYTPPEPYAGLFVDDAIARGDARRARLDYRPLPGFPRDYVLGAIPAYQRQGDEDRVARYVAGYDAEIRYTDAAFGQLVQDLRARGVYDDSAIVLVADHGESLGDHDYYFEHGWFAFEDVLHVPLVVKPPGHPSARVITGSASTLDVTPTLLGLAGRAPPKPLPGHDLMKTDPGMEPMVVENCAGYPERFLGLRTPEWVYLRRLRFTGPPVSAQGAEELYDLRADPSEQHDLASAESERLAALRADLDKNLERQGERLPQRVAPVEPALRDRLRALGYAE